LEAEQGSKGKAVTFAILYGCLKFGFTLGLIGFFSVCGFVAIPLTLSVIGWVLVVGLMKGNARKH
jgi:hypothetical protein